MHHENKAFLTLLLWKKPVLKGHCDFSGQVNVWCYCLGAYSGYLQNSLKVLKHFKLKLLHLL